MQVRYQAALRPEAAHYRVSQGFGKQNCFDFASGGRFFCSNLDHPTTRFLPTSDLQQLNDFGQFLLDRGGIHLGSRFVLEFLGNRNFAF